MRRLATSCTLAAVGLLLGSCSDVDSGLIGVSLGEEDVVLLHYAPCGEQSPPTSITVHDFGSDDSDGESTTLWEAVNPDAAALEPPTELLGDAPPGWRLQQQPPDGPTLADLDPGRRYNISVDTPGPNPQLGWKPPDLAEGRILNSVDAEPAELVSQEEFLDRAASECED